MKLVEQRDTLLFQVNTGVDEINEFLSYLEGPKFQNGEDWVRTWEVTKFLRLLRADIGPSPEDFSSHLLKFTKVLGGEVYEQFASLQEFQAHGGFST